MRIIVSYLILFSLFHQTSLIKANELESNQTKKIIFVVSNAHFYGNSKINAANHFAEIVLAYDEFKKAGYKIDFVSPKGGAVPLGYIQTANPLIKKYLYDCEFLSKLKNREKPSVINPVGYIAIYYVGGGAAMFGVPDNKEIQKIAQVIYEQQNGIISAVCHGTAGLVNITTSDGKYLVSGKKVNGFPDLFEDMKAQYYQEFPFSIEQKIIERGGEFPHSKNGWDNYTITDGRLITGQDPTAAATVAKKVIEALELNKNK
ncbi:type 1 glutamine amidotransferase domain-containing protein [Croceitalea sp. MTPC9]|uniref:type 1 glutamine amidotransferase domain-containing protein n=1 Tax=unclassified Croceitalea TaxID=2632280 RepID=UPI002B39A266|nr:type 1 glutamine amidotransferase domain-containing protein [Croceitalea sp. MTPC6]GMN15706.1 type 1 glutamine amidotransferase domain-containing protein [Croceitalea sp. MTPC9]